MLKLKGVYWVAVVRDPSEKKGRNFMLQIMKTIKEPVGFQPRYYVGGPILDVDHSSTFVVPCVHFPSSKLRRCICHVASIVHVQYNDILCFDPCICDFDEGPDSRPTILPCAIKNSLK